MKKLNKLIGVIAVGVVIVASVFVLASCNLFGCSEGGSCYYNIGSGDSKWCGDDDCDVYLTTVTSGQTTISCDC